MCVCVGFVRVSICMICSHIGFGRVLLALVIVAMIALIGKCSMCVSSANCSVGVIMSLGNVV